MEGGETTLSGFGGRAGASVDTKVLHAFQSSFLQVQTLVDQNRLHINEFNHNHESKVKARIERKR
jgi:hypothetical protein